MCLTTWKAREHYKWWSFIRIAPIYTGTTGASMALPSQLFYFFGVLMFGFLLSVVTHRSTNSNWIVIDSGQNKTSQPKGLAAGQDQVSYPWIGDPTCQRFPVKVKWDNFRNHVLKRWEYLDSCSLRRTKPVPNGHWPLFPGVESRGHVSSSKVQRGMSEYPTRIYFKRVKTKSNLIIVNLINNF